MVTYATFFILLSLFICDEMWASAVSDTEEIAHLPVSTLSQDEKLSLDQQLCDALKAGSEEEVKRLLAEGASSDHHSSLRVAPIYYAAYYGHVDCVKALFDSGATYDVPYAEWFTPHFIALLEGHSEVVKLLRSLGSKLNSDTLRWTSLHSAAFFGDEKKLRSLISQGCSIHAVTNLGETLLHAAAKGGSISCVKYLLSKKADCTARQKNGHTLLHSASAGGLLSLVGHCLEKGINIHAADNEGWQPIHFAARYGSPETVKCLLINGADSNAKTGHGARPVHLAASHADVRSLQALVERNAQIDVPSTWNKRTPLHHAALSNSLACAKFCLSKGIDMEAEDIQGWRALEIAAGEGSCEVLIDLLKRGSPVMRVPFTITNFFRPNCPSALKLAIDGGRAACVGALLDAGAASYPEGLIEESLLEAAVVYGSDSVLKEFVKRLHRLYDSPTKEKQESCLRIAEFFDTINSYKQKYPALAKMTMKIPIQIVTALPETERDFVRAIFHTLRESERAVHVAEEKVSRPLETVLKDDLPILLTQDLTREAVKRTSCAVLRDLFDRFQETGTNRCCFPNNSHRPMPNERRILLNPSQVERKFGETIRQGIDEWMKFLEDPTEASKEYMRTRYGYTPLHFAAMRSSGETVQSLIDRGLSVHVLTYDGLTPGNLSLLHLAALGGKLENMRLIHAAGASINAKTYRGTTVLHSEALGGEVSCVKFCLEAGCAGDERSRDGWRALHYAAFAGSTPVINFLLSAGDSINEPSDMRNEGLRSYERPASPLTLAIRLGHTSTVKALLNGGANSRQIDGGGETPLEYALKYGSEEILQVFIKRMYRVFCPFYDRTEETRSAVYSLLAKLNALGGEPSTEDVLFLLKEDDLSFACIRTVLDELNVKVNDDSPVFSYSFLYRLRSILEKPETLDAVTMCIMQHFKAVCKKLCAGDESNRKTAPEKCMTAKRRAFLDSTTINESVGPSVRASIKKRLTKFTYRLTEQLLNKSIDEVAVNTRRNNLLKAIKNGSVHEVERLLHEGVSPNEKVAGRITALVYAVYYGHKESVQMLLRAGADWEGPFTSNCTPHQLAILLKNHDIAELFSERGSTVEPPEYSDWDELHWASFFGDIETVRTLVHQGAEIDSTTKDGITPLQLAASGGSQTCADFLIEQGADMMARQNNGLALLHCAAEGGLTSVVDRCLKKGLAISMCSGVKGWRPIHYAARYGSPEMLSYLLSKGAYIHAQTDDGLSPLLLAAAGGNICHMRRLVEWGGDLNVCSKSKKSILHLAVVSGSVDCVGFCLSHGLSPTLLDSKGWRPLDYAAERGYSDALKLLLSTERINEKWLELPLRLAIDNNRAKCLKVLLDAGGNPMFGVFVQETPFENAMKNSSLSIIETLMEYSYRLFCPTDLEIGAARVNIDQALADYGIQHKETTRLQKIGYLMHRKTADQVACAILAFLNSYGRGSLRISGLSVEETNFLIHRDDVKDIVSSCLVERIASTCQKFGSTLLDNTKDDNSEEVEIDRGGLATQEYVQKKFGHHIRRGIDEQVNRVVPTHAEPEASQPPDSKGILAQVSNYLNISGYIPRSFLSKVKKT